MTGPAVGGPVRRGLRGDLSRLVVLAGAALLGQQGVAHLTLRVDTLLDRAGFLTGPGPEGLMEVAALPVLAVLLLLFLRPGLVGESGLRLGALGLGAGAGILLADPLARMALHLGAPDIALTDDGSAVRLAVNLLVVGTVVVIFARALLRELRRPPPGAEDERDEH